MRISKNKFCLQDSCIVLLCEPGLFILVYHPRLILQVTTPEVSALIFIGRDGTGTSQASWQKSCSRQDFVVPTVLIDSLLDDECDLLLVWLYRKYSAVIGN